VGRLDPLPSEKMEYFESSSVKKKETSHLASEKETWISTGFWGFRVEKDSMPASEDRS